MGLMEHDLKTWPPFFQDIVDGRKTFEVRRYDHPYRVDDVLVLHEFSPASLEYTGKKVRVRVTYLLNGGQFGIEDGFVVMAITPVAP